MTRPVLLDNVAHRDLRIHTHYGEAYGDALMSVLVVPDEFRSLQAHYPIVFQRVAAQPGFQPVALLGLQAGQNLFLGADGWDAHHVPLAVQRQPFLVGFSGDDLLVHVDLDSPRIAPPGQGQPVFLPHGGNTPYLEHINALLAAMHEGLQQLPAFVRALLQHGLLESFVLDVEQADGSQGRLMGFHTIHEERLAELSAEALHALHQAGHLLPIYMAVASMSCLRDLIERQHALQLRQSHG
jgi:hypothetical protein